MSRILLFNRRYCQGEAWTNRILGYAKGLAELGHDVYLYYVITDVNRVPYCIDIQGVTVVNLWENDGLLAKRNRIISLLKNIVVFIKTVKKGDNVFFYGLYPFQFTIANIIRKKAKVYFETTEHPAINSKMNESDVKKLFYRVKKIEKLFVISNALKDYYVSIGMDKNRIKVVNMFVDTNRFENLKKTTSEKYIAYCGAVSYNKDGVNILVEAFSKFYQLHKDYKLYIIGKGLEPNVIKKLKNLAMNGGVLDAVVFTGPISPAEMPQMLYNASILALARPNNLQAQNGFPTKLGEYLATGNPVVVTSVGEIPFFIKDGVNGFLSEPNSDSFAERLSYVADHYEEAKAVGKEGKKLSNEAFNYKTQSKVVSDEMSCY